MADQSSSEVNDEPFASPFGALSISTRIKTRPISKMIARIPDLGIALTIPGSREGRLRARRGAASPQKANDGGEQRKKNNNDDDVMDALADIGNGTTEEVSAENHSADPESATKNVIDEVARIRHLGSARDRRTKSADDGDEARQNHGAPSIFLIEFMSALEVAAAEEKRVFTAVERSSGTATDPVTELITNDGAEHDWDEDPFQGNNSGGGKDTRGDEQGVAGKKETDKKASFNEDDNANKRRAAPAD